jgi:hypothetical protein
MEGAVEMNQLAFAVANSIDAAAWLVTARAA